MATYKQGSFQETFVQHLTHKDYKVSLVGTIVGKTEKGFLLADSTGEAYITTADVTGDFAEGRFVRVLGHAMSYESGFEINAVIIQDLSNVHKEALQAVRKKLIQTPTL